MTTHPSPYFVDPDIRKAHTLPSDVYIDPEQLEFLKKMNFRSSWQWVGGKEIFQPAHNLVPHEFMPGFIPEPMLMIQKDGQPGIFSNVCTHRANILVEKSCQKPFISCRYHGRCFHLDGRFRSMPEFEHVDHFPSANDDLKAYHLTIWRGLMFSALDPALPLTDIFSPIQATLGSFPFEKLEFLAEHSKKYVIQANWLAYCDNYLEGFHIPFVHPALNQAIRFEDYEVRVFPHCNVQVARCKPGQTPIPLSENDPDFGQDIYAYYWFIYPNMMLNFYHWGISVNWVLPQNSTTTEVRFYTFCRNDVAAQEIERTALHATEMEDEAVVENVQKGLRGEAYNRGRFSPSREQGVHAFHEYLYREVFSKLKT